MNGYVFMAGVCYGCHRIFMFNPNKVPSIRIEGERRPVCRGCVEVANPRRVANGLDPIVPHPDAYEPLPEGELP